MIEVKIPISAGRTKSHKEIFENAQHLTTSPCTRPELTDFLGVHYTTASKAIKSTES